MMTRWLGQAEAAAAVKPMSDQELVAAVATAPKSVVIFYSPNCPYSRKFLPIYEALAPQYPDVLFASVNVDQHVQQAGVNKVQMLPTVVFMVNGQPVGRIDGVQDQADFTTEMSKAFSGTTQAAATTQTTTPSQRSGTLIDTQASPSMLPYVLGGAAAVGVLGTAAYFIFRK